MEPLAPVVTNDGMVYYTTVNEDGFGGTGFDTPFGKATWRALDHQSTLGTYVGKTALKDGKPRMVDWRYVDGADALPSDAEVKKMRPA